jgi:hypothetical protein
MAAQVCRRVTHRHGIGVYGNAHQVALVDRGVDVLLNTARAVRWLLTLGSDGTHGIGRLSLISWIRLYRMIPVPLRHRWHPAPGSSHNGLAAALRGEGPHGVAMAIRTTCGCMPQG